MKFIDELDLPISKIDDWFEYCLGTNISNEDVKSYNDENDIDDDSYAFFCLMVRAIESNNPDSEVTSYFNYLDSHIYIDGEKI